MKTVLILCLGLLGACTQKSTGEKKSETLEPRRGNSEDITPVKGGESAATAGKGPTPKPGEEDTLSIPAHIAGSYLTCAVRKEASEASLESEIGCRLSDAASGNKLAADAKLSFSNSKPEKVTSELQAEASIYHVLYRIKGESKDAILQTIQSLDALVFYADKNLKTELIAKVLKPAIELDDYEAPIVREQAIDRDDAGSL